MATTKKNPETYLNRANQKLVHFCDELQKLTKDASRITAHAIVEKLLYSKVPPHLMKSVNQAHLENRAFEQIFKHLGKELELNGLLAFDELHINCVSQHATITNADRSKLTCHHSKNPGQLRIQGRLLKKQREQVESTQDIPRNKNSRINISNPNTNVKNKNNKIHKNSNRAKRKPKTVYPLCQICGKTNHCTGEW